MNATSKLLLMTAGLLAWIPGAMAQTASEVREGHWVQVKGHLDESGSFRAESVRILDPEDEESVVGTVEQVKSDSRFLILGQEVHVSGRTRWKGVRAGSLLGARVKAEGQYRGRRNLSAGKVEVRKPGRDRIEGRLDDVERHGDDLVWTVMSFRIVVRPELELDQEERLEDVKLAPERIRSQTRRERDEDDEIPGNFQLGNNLTLGGQIAWESTFEDNFNLDDDNREDRTDHEPSIRVQLLWEPSEDFFILGGARSRYRWRTEQGQPDEELSRTVVTELFAQVRDVFGSGLSVQVGRQDFDEKREWLYDQNLDALRVIYEHQDFRVEASASTTISDGSKRDEDSLNLIAYVSNNDWDRHVAGYVVDRMDTTDSGEHFTHAGVRLLGDWIPETRTWFEGAYLFGESNGLDLHSYGLDVGGTWFPLDSRSFYVTAGWAMGSGDDDPGDGTNGTFRQTGLQDNNDKWGGVTSFRYYGELVDPELANLGILTLGVGVRPTKKTSVDVVWHDLWQVEAANRLIGDDLGKNPDGVHEDIGWELDVIFGSRAIDNWHFEVVGGYFNPGDAFPGADPAFLTRFQIRFNF